MSYILEALKKLEEKRHRVESPHDLLAAHTAAPRRIERRTTWRFILTAALILNAGLLLWWLRPWQPSAAHGPGDRVEARASDVSPAPGAMVRMNGGKAVHRTKGGASAASKKGGDLRVTPDPPARPAATGRTEQAGFEPAQPKSAAGGERKIVSIGDLPPSVRQDLPDITIAGHFYSPKQSSRVVVINGKMAHEGQAITGGLRLEQVTPDGVIMSFQGYRFRRGVF